MESRELGSRVSGVKREFKIRNIRRLAAVALVIGGLAAGAQTAQAAPPGKPHIIEPSVDGQVLSAADVHMEANGYSDPDGNPQGCSDWSIWTAPANPDDAERIWHADCAPTPGNVHIHLGDGDFIGSYTGHITLEDDTDYVLHVDFHDSTGAIGPEATRPFSTYPANPPGDPQHPWEVKQPDYVVQNVANDLQLPVDIAFVPHPGTDPGDPLLYVTELYGTIKVITRDGHESNYASGLLNFNRPATSRDRVSRALRASPSIRCPATSSRARCTRTRPPPITRSRTTGGPALPQHRRRADRRHAAEDPRSVPRSNRRVTPDLQPHDRTQRRQALRSRGRWVDQSRDGEGPQFLPRKDPASEPERDPGGRQPE